MPTLYVLDRDIITKTAIERSPPTDIWNKIVIDYAVPSL